MEVNEQGILEDTTFWKMGCNWGKGAPSFYDVVENYKIVLRHKNDGDFRIEDLILIADGHNIIAIAQVEGKPVRMSEDQVLVEEFEKYKLDEFEDIFYYPVRWLELEEDEQFLYQLQQGIIQVRQEDIKLKASSLWIKHDSEIDSDKRIMRITWNTKNWELPSGHRWNYSNRDKNNVAYENQYGYGGEEWLFNERYRTGGYQYGFIRGVNNLSETTELVTQIALYTISPDKQRYLVGVLYNVEIILGYEFEELKAEELFSKYLDDMTEELLEVNADPTHLKDRFYKFNVKFKWDDVDLFNSPIPVNYLSGARFNRFQAYHLNADLYKDVSEALKLRDKFNFDSGKAKHSKKHTRSNSGGKTNVNRRHGVITDDLYDYLLSQDIDEENISVEKTRVGGSIIDVVVKGIGDYTLFEIKTSHTALKNIRLALGQIVEYALMDKEVNCSKLIIVGPAKLTIPEKEYFERVKNLIKVKLEYWEYIADENLVKNKFLLN